MSAQHTFASQAWVTKKKVTRRERFLDEMDVVIPWATVLDLIRPHYPTAGRGRPRSRSRPCSAATSCRRGSTSRTRPRRMRSTTARPCVTSRAWS